MAHAIRNRGGGDLHVLCSGRDLPDNVFGVDTPGFVGMYADVDMSPTQTAPAASTTSSSSSAVSSSIAKTSRGF